ncbi:MAG TPA: HAD hydrolase-like protein [bacterium]|nr:HAD hydrolase-like protein [bacterium]
MAVRTVLFDLDGTLIDSHHLIIASFRHACRQVLGREITDEHAQVRWGQPLGVRFAAVAPDCVPALVDAYAQYYDRHERTLASVFPGVPELLAALAGRACAIGVVTSKRGRAAAQALRVLGLAPWITTSVGAEDAPAPKPAADPIRVALRRLEAVPESSLMVGDAPFDLQAARAAGVRSAAALWGARDIETLLACAPDYVARSPGDVALIVESA